MATERTASISWEGDLASGVGKASAVTSGVFKDLPVSWPSRTERPERRTSPEELIAAAHASCFSMALAANLGRENTPPEKLDVSATVTFENPGTGWKITKSALTVRGRVPGIDEAKFKAVASAAKEGCPVSRALSGNVELSVDASLE